MISVLAQERLLGAALGSILTGVVIFEQRKSIYKSIHHSEPQPTEPIFGRNSRQEFAHAWNKSVDNTFVPMIEYLSSRGW
ncbi:zinc finger protein [Perilla frutescens var. frutescens]|nr:zinc finger protein [Perilla frutescens var. frutescens]